MGEVSAGLKRFNQYITNSEMQSYIMTVLKDRAGSFVNNIVAIVANNAKLQECEPGTLLYAGMKATALNLPLDPSLGMAYVIPFKNTNAGVTEAQFQIGTKGFKQLALRSGQFQCINVSNVREGEIKKRNRLSGEIEFKFEEDDEKRNQLKVIGYVSYFRLLNGFESTLYMTVEELKEHGLRYSQTFKSKNNYVRNSSKWSTDFEDMAKKTVLKLNLSRNAPLSVEMQDAVIADQAVIRETGMEYVDNNPEPVIDEDKAKKVAEMFGENPTDATIVG